MEMSGEIKKAGELVAGDCITATGYGDDAAEVEEIIASGEDVLAILSNGHRVSMDPDKIVRLYQ